MKTINTISMLFKVYAFALILFASLFAGEINKTFFGGNAVNGYDVVAYFTESKPVEGKKDFTYRYKDANWLFSSKENLELFQANPEKYEPQYGGYCAWAVAVKSKKYGTEPDLWTIVDGKLYLNYSKSVQKDWKEDIPGFIVQADKNWPKIKNN